MKIILDKEDAQLPESIQQDFGKTLIALQEMGFKLEMIIDGEVISMASLINSVSKYSKNG